MDVSMYVKMYLSLSVLACPGLAGKAAPAGKASRRKDFQPAGWATLAAGRAYTPSMLATTPKYTAHATQSFTVAVVRRC